LVVNQTFINHVNELRRRLSWSALVLFIGAAVGYVFRVRILMWLQAPLHSQLYYGKVTGAFEFVMQICFFVGLCLSVPMLVYQLISFIRPALPRPISNRLVLLVVSSSCVLTVSGVGFAYYLTLPAVLRFLRSMAGSQLNALIMADSYLSFVITYLAIFAIIFQLPLILLFIDRITPLTPKKLGKWRKWVMIGSFGAGVILPITPDPLSQVMLALPVIVLYEISIWLIWVLRRMRKEKLAILPATDPVALPPQELRQAGLAKQSVPRRTVASRPPRPVVDRRRTGTNVIDLRNL
jgi:sec-independent protein translocase protein TatC